jgi:hypothetical protein
MMRQFVPVWLASQGLETLGRRHYKNSIAAGHDVTAD